jgi:D-alanyl-D-alanine carboxypeptidase
MTYTAPAPAAARRTRSIAIYAVVIVGAALVGILVDRSLASSFSSTASPIWGPPVGEADGVVPKGVTVFDDTVPAVANLDPDFLDALRRAAKDAANDRIEFVVNSGWRSPRYQDQMLREAVQKYGSAEEAARWVATAETSAHVSGDAIDIGPAKAAVWLSENGARYGLCQIYRNEPWHFELRPEAIDGRCPRLFADPTEDPRMYR